MLERGEALEAVACARAALAKMDTKRGAGKQYAAFVEQVLKAASQ
jgi:hypothetical protein